MAPRQFGATALSRLAAASTRRARWVLGGWLLIAVALNVVVPQLEKVVARDATPFLPASSASIQALGQMDKAFGRGDGRSIAFVVLRGPGFTADPADQAYYRALSARLHAGRAHVADLQDYTTQPSLQTALTSADGDATYVPVSLRHPVGSPQADQDVAWLRQAVARDRPPDVHGYVTGDVASIADLTLEIQHSIGRVTIVSVAIIIVILLLLYRSMLLPLVPLATIGVGLLTARGLVSLLGQSFLPVSTYTGTFLTALVLGAGTDYTVFLISRFHEAMRGGMNARDGIVESVRRIGPVVVASGLTVIIGSACMVLAKLALFNTTGPAIAVAILVTLAVGLTFTPALLAVMGDRAGPRPVRAAKTRAARSSGGWAAVATLVSRRPLPIALASVAFLASLAAFWPTLHPSYDTRQLIPASVESSQGYSVLSQHFPGNELRPDYVLVHSDHDLRNPSDLAALEQAAATLGKLPDVAVVRGITRPQGQPIQQAQLGVQLGKVGDRLGQAGSSLTGSSSGVSRLASGADQLAAGAGQLSSGTDRAAGAVDLFLAGLSREASGLGTATSATSGARDGAVQLRDGAHLLAAALRDAHDQTGSAVRGLRDIYAVLATDRICTTDPICRVARTQLHRIYVGERDRLLPGLARAAAAAQRIGDGDGSLAEGLDRLRAGLHRADDGIARLAAGERTFRHKLGRLAGGAAALARGAGRLPPGVSRLRSAAHRLAHGLDRASTYLTSTAQASRAAGISAFYLPASALGDPRLASARDYYLSPDGHTSRLMVYHRNDTSHIGDEQHAAALAMRGTPLAGAHLSVTGPTAVDDDIHHLADSDLRLVALVTLGAVFMILVLLLRALVAPLYLLASVVLSYGAAMGISALVWQDLLGKPIDFTMPLLAFVILVAVGADYNILLMSRVREESRHATRAGVARAVTATGGVITSAGMIFAGTFIAMATSPVLGLAETGTAIAIGLLLDTFVVRSLLVPSVAALLGRYNWWPGDRKRAIAPSLRGLRSVTDDRASADRPRAAS
ncbi:MAG: putative drug exporter of the superfamily [Frankiaceae bacterium]|nr:putative drug exporter of the superfamily [Frankiaceae bacterium]